MVDGLTFHHLMVALFFWLVTWLLACRIMPLHYASFISFIKIAIPFIYFSFFYTGQWTFLDDWSYFLHGLDMLDAGFTPISALSSEGVSNLKSHTGGNHILYSYWNTLSLYFFGKYYYAPVYMNIMLTFVSAIVFHGIVLISGFGLRYALYGSILFLLHWDILAWISLLNLKGSVVIFLELLAIYSLLSMFKKRKIGYVLLFLISCYLFYWVRFYIPFFLIASVGLWIILDRPEHRLRYLLVFFSVFLVLYKMIDLDEIFNFLNFSNIPYGLLRMLLTPQPWSINPHYSFLLIPSILQWVLLIPTIWGIFLLWKSSREARLIILFSCCILFLYAIFPREQGPRHRLQVVYMFSWGLFHFGWIFFKKLSLRF